MLEYGNVFDEEEKDLTHITSRHVMDDIATSSVREARKIGKTNIQLFVQERLVKGSTSLYDTLKD